VQGSTRSDHGRIGAVVQGRMSRARVVSWTRARHARGGRARRREPSPHGDAYLTQSAPTIAEHPNLDLAARHALTRPLAGAEALEWSQVAREQPAVAKERLYQRVEDIAPVGGRWVYHLPAMKERPLNLIGVVECGGGEFLGVVRVPAHGAKRDTAVKRTVGIWCETMRTSANPKRPARWENVQTPRSAECACHFQPNWPSNPGYGHERQVD
jgi:hypothetical protein